MGDFTSLGSMLTRTSNQLEDYSRENPKSVPIRDTEQITKQVKDINKEILKEIKRQPINEFDQAALTNILGHISKIKRKMRAVPQETSKLTPHQKLQNVLGELQGTLKELKKQKKMQLSAEVKIEGLRKKGGMYLNKDLTRLLSTADKGLSHLRESSKAQGQITEAQYGEMNAILKKAHIALAKGMALHKTLPRQFMPDIDQSVIGKILKDIPFLHHHASAQVKAGTARVQASSFRSNLKEFKTLLQTLRKLKKSRGGQAAQIEQDQQK
jgi:hypothetical protein